MRSCKIQALLALFSLLTLAACAGCQQAIGEQTAREPEGGRDVKKAEAHAGDAVARAEGGAEARAGDAVAKAESRAESHIEGSGDGERAREATLKIEGDPGTGFSGTCTIGDEVREESAVRCPGVSSSSWRVRSSSVRSTSRALVL